MTYSAFSDNFLVAAYLEMNEGRNGLSAGELLDKYDLKPRSGWIEAAIGEFSNRGWVENDPTLGDERQLTVLLKGRGIRAAEGLIDQGVMADRKDPLPPGVAALRQGTVYTYETEVPPDFGGPGDIFLKLDGGEAVPASDRVVRLDHNSQPVTEVRAAAADLVQQIRRGNDLGNLTIEEANAAANEVYQLGLFFDAEMVRPSTVMALAGPTLRWIADKAGGTLVGAAALALLGAIATLFGLAL